MVNTHAPCHHYWRKVILQRDGYRCRACGSKANPELAHVRDKSRYSDEEESYCFENLVCLCRDCHTSHHFLERGLPCDVERAKRVKLLFDGIMRGGEA